VYLLVVLGYLILVVLEFIPLYHQKQWRDFWTNAALGAISFTIVICISVGIKLPSPEAPIREFITSIFGR